MLTGSETKRRSLSQDFCFEAAAFRLDSRKVFKLLDEVDTYSQETCSRNNRKPFFFMKLSVILAAYFLLKPTNKNICGENSSAIFACSSIQLENILNMYQKILRMCHSKRGFIKNFYACMQIFVVNHFSESNIINQIKAT